MLAKYILVAAAVAGGALAETKCDAKPQLDLCLQNMSSNVDACNKEKLNDAVCLCKAYKIYRDNCYTLCPKDPGNATNDNYISSWCISAGGENESSSSVSVPASTSTDSTNTETSAPSTTGGETEPSQTGSSDDGDDGDDDTTETTGTSTSTSDASAETDNAANGLAPAGVMLAAAAVMGLVL